MDSNIEALFKYKSILNENLLMKNEVKLNLSKNMLNTSK